MEPLEPSDPRRIGPYTLFGRLGAGGMGAVYLGRSTGGHTAAVKLIRPEFADDQGFRARFSVEVTAAQRASGAFTAPVLNADPDADVPWLATSFVPGISLQQAVRLGGPLPEAVLRHLTAGIAEALVNIHAVGLTHRDLKPANVLLALDGPYVIDFGIARAAEGSNLTATGSVLGTPSYMSPEQGRGEEVTPASDVFSLGSTIAFAASGSGLFGEGAPLQILRRVVDDEPDLTAVPAGLRLTIAACLAKNAADRPTPQQIVAFAEAGAPALTAGAWLPPVLTAAIEEAAAVLAPLQVADAVPNAEPDAGPGSPPDPRLALSAGPPPASPPSSVVHGLETELSGMPPAPAVPPAPPSAPPTPPPPAPAPSRRKLLIGLAGGAVALAGGGTVLALTLPDGSSAKAGDKQGGKKSSASLTDPKRALDPKTVATPRWTVKISEPLAQLTGAGDLLVAATKKQLHAFDRAGKPAWGPVPNTSYPGMGGIGGQPLAVQGDTVFAIHQTSTTGGATFELRAHNLTTGRLTWVATNPGHKAITAWVPGTLDGVVYVTGELMKGELSIDPDGGVSGLNRQSFIWAVDIATRSIPWSTTFDNFGVGQATLRVPSSGTHLLWSSANTDGSAPKLSGLDVKAKGKAQWEQPAPGGGATSGSSVEHFIPAWHDGPYTSAGGYFLYLNDHLYAIDPTNGQVAWQSEGQVTFHAVTASPDDKTVFAVAPDYQGSVFVYAFEAKTGTVRWAGSLSMLVTGGLAIQSADDTVYVWGKSQLWALDPEDGTGRWTYEFGGSASLGEPIALWAGGGQVYGSTGEGITALSATGK